MTNPINPNFKPGVGRLATDRYDFALHYEGQAFNHTAGQIVLSPSITIGSAVISDVQTAIAALSGSFIVPTVPDATKTSKGVIQLGGDLNGLNSTALNPQLSALQGTTLSISGPSANQVLQWNGSAWVNSTLAPATTSLPGTILLSTVSSSSTGDLGGSFNNTKVIGLQGFPVSTSAPVGGNVLVWSGTSWGPGSAAGTPQATASIQGTIQLAGDLAGAGSVATAPRVGSINGATVPATPLTPNQVLTVSGASALSYALLVDANIAPGAAIQGSKVTPSFVAQPLSTTGTAALGATTITGALVAGAGTAFNTLTGAFTVTTKTVTASTDPTAYTVDTGTTDYIIFVDTTSGVVNITLPTASTSNGRRLVIKDKVGNAQVKNINMIPPLSSTKIEGIAGSASNKILSTNWGSWTFVCNGTDWFMI